MPALRPALFAALLALALTPAAWGQARPDTLRLIVVDGVARVDTTDGRLRALAPVVVTATRTARALEDVPVPTTVLPAEAIREQGALRLADLLAEQPGLVVVEGLGGSGLQLQGFDADYTLVLLDGEPVVGRTAGTLDLDRLAVTGVDRVEVVRGPLSSRFGADALAGVVNLVSRRPGETTGGRAALRVESLGVTDLSAEAETGREAWGVRLFVNRYGSEGFTFEPGSQTLALPAYSDYAAELRARYAPAEGTDLDLHARLAAQEQEGAALFAGILYDEEASRTDWSLRPALRHRFSPRLRAEASGYASGFRNEWFAVTRETGEVFEDAEFTHTYQKGEAGLTWLPRGRAVLHVGAGAIRERIAGERYASAQTSAQPYAYAEAEWTPHPRLDLVASARYDAPSDYAARLTPRLAALARPTGWLRVRASVGSGYRAPDFRQRYLAFTNPAGGYALYGAEEARERIAALEAAGGIDAYLLDPSRLGPLRAEGSTAFGLGLEADLPGGLSLRVNGFHNEVRDLIDTLPVALRTNGQQVFSYFNLDRIYTRGVEADATWGAALRRGLGAVRVQAGYQLLDTADRDVLDAIAAGTLFRRTPEGRDVRVGRSDYGGLFGRSRHAGTLRVAHRHEGLGLSTAARLVLRSRYGFADRNSSGVLDEDREYAPGYALLNLTTTKTLGRFDVQAGARNVLDHTDPVYLPAQPGRVLFAGASVRF